MRALARLALTLLLAGSLVLSVWTAHALARLPEARWFADRALAGIAPAMERALARHATPETVAARLEALIAETPRNWAAIEALTELAEERGLPLPAALADRIAAHHAADFSLTGLAGRCGQCLLDTTACDVTLLLSCRLPVELTVAGDLAGLLRAGAARARGAAIDEVDLGLSVAGLAATVLVPFTGGASAPAKAGLAVGRTAWRAGLLAPGLAAPFLRAAREGVDWAALPRALLRGDPARALRREVLDQATRVLQDAARLRAATCASGAVLLLARADSPAELARIARGAEVLGPRAPGAMEALGKSRFLRATLRWSHEAWALAAALVTGLGALASALGSALSTLLLRALRRLARPARPDRRPKPEPQITTTWVPILAQSKSSSA